MPIETIIAYIVASAIFAAVPGPGVLATVGQAVSRGVRPAFALLSGLIIGDFAYLVAAAFGLGFIAQQFNEIFSAIRFVGAAYLIWLGWSSWRRPVETAQEVTGVNNSRTLLGGLIISLSNPKVMVFYLAFLPTFVDMKAIGLSQVLLLGSLNVIVSYVVIGTYIAAARSVAKSFEKPAIKRRFNRVAGGMLITAGVAVAVQR